jgi:hypothetical protein
VDGLGHLFPPLWSLRDVSYSGVHHRRDHLSPEFCSVVSPDTSVRVQIPDWNADCLSFHNADLNYQRTFSGGDGDFVRKSCVSLSADVDKWCAKGQDSVRRDDAVHVRDWRMNAHCLPNNPLEVL